MKPLTDADKGLLALVVSINGWYVAEGNIVAAGHLVERGLPNADSDYDGVRLLATEAGEKAAKRLGLVKRAEPGTYRYSLWERTEEGFRLTT